MMNHLEFNAPSTIPKDQKLRDYIHIPKIVHLPAFKLDTDYQDPTLPFLKLIIGQAGTTKIKINSLLDSGASWSFLHKRVADQIRNIKD